KILANVRVRTLRHAWRKRPVETAISRNHGSAQREAAHRGYDSDHEGPPRLSTLARGTEGVHPIFHDTAPAVVDRPICCKPPRSVRSGHWPSRPRSRRVSHWRVRYASSTP